MKTAKTLIVTALAAANLLGCTELMADRYDDGRRDAYPRDRDDRGGYDRDRDAGRDRDPGYGRDRDRDRGDWNRDWDRRRTGLEKLGTVWARKDLDRDVVEVGGHGRFTSIVFRVDRGDIKLEDLKITFGNDDSISPEMKHFFREGERSYRVEFPRGGIGREIKRIRFLYRAVGRGPAVIDVYGEPAR
ncbi:MAG: hypothetical protein JWO31_2596 [Phycisphaerales bacterium]|nr:hypothetical protein [Phycisphaerales bacterium]